MSVYESMPRAELKAQISVLREQYAAIQEKRLKLNMARGVPSAEQLDLSNEILESAYTEGFNHTEEGFDARSYGCLDGLIEAKRLMSGVLDVPAENVIIGGNSSLNLMYDTIARNMLFGTGDGCAPWSKLERVKFLCPVPGYDRHFAICEDMGIEMISVPMTAEGPDMDIVEKLVSSDDSVKGIWCTPMYSNPDGTVYSDETVRRFAALKPAAKDFRIFWDNAYCVHHLTDDHPELLNLFYECQKQGNENLCYIFASFSKVTYPGAAISVLASGKKNLDEIRKHLSKQTIGSDKMNQLRHIKFFRDLNAVEEHMLKHRAILKPKFDAVCDTLDAQLKPLGIGNWTRPKGGYFISVDLPEGCAKRIVALCKEAGVILTPAGATHPYGNDLLDRNLRIAPTFPPIEELLEAMNLFCAAAKLAAAEKAYERAKQETA